MFIRVYSDHDWAFRPVLGLVSVADSVLALETDSTILSMTHSSMDLTLDGIGGIDGTVVLEDSEGFMTHTSIAHQSLATSIYIEGT